MLAVLNESQKTPLVISTALIGVGILAEEADDIVAELWDSYAWSDLSGDPVEIPEDPVAAEVPEKAIITDGHVTAWSGIRYPWPKTPEAAEIVEKVKQEEKARRGSPRKEKQNK